MFSRFKLSLGLFTLLLGGLFAPQVFAQQQPPADANVEVETFQDWEVRCPQGGGAPGDCTMTQLVDNPNGDSPIMRVIMAYPSEMDTAAMAFILPLGTRLAPGLQLAVDNGEPINFPYQVCQQQGCRADIPVTDSLRQQMRSGSRATLSIMGPRGERLDLPVSLQGFTAADNRIAR
ncbi:Invasion protein IalB, involved in pathogenesis [Modicisalibacter ilicicola DSM 19980]|uniref:Invasion protein IalB, involved in pathogenesis n=1 Tax=Modicisalibacter ilicicola DSM 19980 TaxID=1121942 RepID=A0A1M5BGZ3_9GAMM|nr:invasion associated locus B family protein [Halomonas ilicicola]SHF41731.1 Invasion protein IalB, involved in pathogenesis [Halomonas ilicicola DSM 19980]